MSINFDFVSSNKILNIFLGAGVCVLYPTRISLFGMLLKHIFVKVRKSTIPYKKQTNKKNPTEFAKRL